MRLDRLHRRLHRQHLRHHHGWIDDDGHAGHRGHWRSDVRAYFGAHLHRRLFWWFGASILATSVVSAVSFHLVAGPGRVRQLVPFFVAGLVLWMMSGKVARRIARPLYELVQVTQQIGAGRLSAPAR